MNGVDLVFGLLDQYWEHVHPIVDPSELGATMRVNALAELAAADTMLNDLRQSVVADLARKGRVTVRDILIALNRLQAGSTEPVKSLNEIEGLLRDSYQSNPTDIAALLEVGGSVARLSELMSRRLGSDAAEELEPLRIMFRLVDEVLVRVVGRAAAATPSVSPESAGSLGADRASAQIQSREDAIRMLERVSEFIERSEPANPAPLFIRRAQRLLTKSFVEIIEDLAPDSLPGIRTLAGLKEQV